MTIPRFYEKEYTLLSAVRQGNGGEEVEKATSPKYVSLNKGLDLCLFREIMHKQQGELYH